MKRKLIRITTVLSSQQFLLRGQLTYMSENGFEVLSISNHDHRSEYFELDSSKYIFIPLARQISLLRDLKCLWKLFLLLRREKPLIVHTHTPKAGLLGMLAAWLCRVPHRFHTVAGLPVMESAGVMKIILNCTEQLTYWCATRVLPNSVGLLNYIRLHYSLAENKTRVIGHGSSNGINVSHYTRNEELDEAADRIRRQLNLQANEKVVIFVGRLVKDKGIGELIAAFRRLSGLFNLRLILVGPFEEDLDPLRAEDLQFIQSSQQIHLAGFQSDVRPWLMLADLFVFPSYREGFPNVVLQACCMMIPCIVTDINGCNEIIKDRETGMLVPSRNEEALAEAIQFMIESSALAKQMAKNAREFVVKYFDQQYFWKELLDEYQQNIG